MDIAEAKKTLKTMKENIDKKYLKTRNSVAIETALNLLEKKDKEIEELKADNSHQWEERCKLTFELEKKDEYIKMLTDERDTLIQERDYYKARYNEFNNAFIETKEKE